MIVVALVLALGFTSVWTNTLSAGDRFHGLVTGLADLLDAPSASPSPLPASSPAAIATVQPTTRQAETPGVPTPAPTPTRVPAPLQVPVDVNLVHRPEAVFASQITNKDCAVAGTQMVLAVLGLGDNSAAAQLEIHDRIGEWESWDDSHNGGWGPTAIALALAAHGADGYEVRVYDTREGALRASAVALSTTHKPVVLLSWWGAHTWVMTGYRADADPTVFVDATVTGTYILDPWYPRVSTIWGASDPPGTFQDAAEMVRNFIGWSRPEGAYPDRDGRYVVVLPTTPRPPELNSRLEP